MSKSKPIKFPVIEETTPSPEKRFCKGCHADVTKDMFCFCGEFPLTKEATLSEEELRKYENK